MAEVFKRTELRFGGAFQADRGILTPNKGLNGVLMMNLQVNHTRQLSRMYDIGPVGATRAVYLIGGPTEGQMGVGHVAGPDVALAGFYDSFSDICEAETNTIQLELAKIGCGRVNGGLDATGALTGVAAVANSTARVRYKCKFCVLDNVGFQVSSETLLINERSALRFYNMEYEELRR
jgi:hypothetical protein